jgi:hypothetical protein
MNKKYLTLISYLLFITIGPAQIPPQAMNYSAVARNASGQPISSTTIGIQISILKSSPAGNAAYIENHIIVTDEFGLFNLIIGSGEIQFGSMDDIEWNSDKFFLKVAVDIDGGTNFTTMGTIQFISVPYAFHAKTAERLTGADPIISSLPTLTTKPVINVTSNSATLGGLILDAKGNQIAERGIVYSTLPNPAFNASKIVIGNGIGAFDSILATNYNYPHILKPNTTYYVRAYATTENNLWSFGNEVSFKTLPVGYQGPGGGLVFYDKGNKNEGWQYLEASKEDLDGQFIWGCSGISIPGTNISVGSGQINTEQIIKECAVDSIAAKECYDFISGGFDDWYLPSRDELNLMYLNLHLNNQGNFQPSLYWSSSEYYGKNPIFNNLSGAWPIDYYDGISIVGNLDKRNKYFVRAIRDF